VGGLWETGDDKTMGPVVYMAAAYRGGNRDSVKIELQLPKAEGPELVGSYHLRPRRRGVVVGPCPWSTAR
jgi:hypothetical protein